MQIVAVTDPLQVGFRCQAMVGIRTDGDSRMVAKRLAAVENIDYVVMCTGSFDILVELVCEDEDALLELLNGVDPSNSRRAGHRDVHVPETDQTDLYVGDPMTEPISNRRRSKRAPTDICGCTSPGCPVPTTSRSSSAAKASGSTTRRQALPRRAVRAVHQPGRPRPDRAGRGRGPPGQHARLLPDLELRPPDGGRAGRPTGRADPGGLQPDLLHHRWLRGGGVGVEAGPPVLQGDRPAQPRPR